MGEGELELCLPSPMFGRGAGGEGKDLSLHWDAPPKRTETLDFPPYRRGKGVRFSYLFFWIC
jgi:hypothetical protein